MKELFYQTAIISDTESKKLKENTGILDKPLILAIGKYGSYVNSKRVFD